jgi:hypothetical protein
MFLIPAAVSADRGSIPYEISARIFEPTQDTLIAWNGEEEILILSTELYSSKKTKVLEVLPLPAEPIVEESSREIIRKAERFLFESTNVIYERPLLDLRSDSRSAEPAGEVVQEIVIGSHDIAVTKALNADQFTDWVNSYLKEKGNDNPIIPTELAETIKNYLDRGFNYFVFDIIELDQEPVFNEAISYRFKTDRLYYPLEITKSDHGISTINLIILSNQNMLNFDGIDKERVKTVMGPVLIDNSEIEEISADLAELFNKDRKEDQKKIPTSIVSWEIRDDLANFHDDLLVGSDLSKLKGQIIEYKGTDYYDSFRSPDYPFEADREIKYLNGKVEERIGTRMHPWRAYAVDGYALFNAETKNLITNFDALGDNVTIKGYYYSGSIIMRDPFDKMPVIIEIDRAFFVTEIIGWEYYTGRPMNNYGQLIDKRIAFWLKR